MQRARWAGRVFGGKGVGTFASMGMERRVARRVRSRVMYSFLSGGLLGA